MEQSFPLKAFGDHQAQGYDYNVYSSPSQGLGGNPNFTIPRWRNNHGHGFGMASTGYEPLSGVATGYGPPPPPPPPPAVKRSPGCLSSLTWWMPEIFAALLATGALASIIVVLRFYEGRALVEIDLPASLSLNGIITLAATIGRAALMVPVGSALSQEAWIWFSREASPRRHQQPRSRLQDLDLSDSASRGIWGSFLFLLFARNRWVAYIGVLVTMLSLVFGTATQQLLAFENVAVSTQNTELAPGNIPRVETWQYYNAVPSEGMLTPPLAVRASMYNGILSKAIDPITVNCPTGNCTWPTTSSLAVCGECSPASYTMSCDETECNYIMPSGSEISLTNDGSGGLGFVVDSSSSGGIYNASLNDRLYLVNFDVVGAPYRSRAQEFRNDNATASECALWMCIQAYNTSMTAGRVQQEVIMTFSNVTAPATTYFLDNYTFVDIPAEMKSIPDVTYDMSVIGSSGFTDTLHQLCNGTAFLDVESSFPDNDVVDAIWNSSADLNPWIQNLATSMTNAIRCDDPDPHPPTRYPYQTTTSRRSVYDGKGLSLGLKVRWYWILLPAASVALSHLFLIIIMVQTARSSVAPWKSSLLTFLFFDTDQELQQAASGRLHERGGVAKVVGSTTAVLREDVAGKWSFKVA